MRVRIAASKSLDLFKKAREKTGGWTPLAKRLGSNGRTLRDWKRGISTIPKKVFVRLLQIVGLQRRKLKVELLSDHWHIRDAARKGAHARMKKYGNPGTPEGRRRGGLASIAAHAKLRTGFNFPKIVQIPRKSAKLAELLGILFGDGHLSSYQVSVTTNGRTDAQHAKFIRNLLQNLFKTPVALKFRIDENAANVVMSSKSAVLFLNKMGMPIGNKISNGLAVPLWVRRSATYTKTFLRGLFDTDGCIYLDSHRIGKKVYRHMGWTITSYSDTLLGDVLKILKQFGFSPTLSAPGKSAFLRRQREIHRYFSKIGSHNPKHLKRYQKFRSQAARN